MPIYFGNIDLNSTSSQPFYLGTASVSSLWMGNIQVWPPVTYDYNIFILGTSTFIPDTQLKLENKLTGENIVRYSNTSTTVSASSLTNFTIVDNAFSSSTLGGIISFESDLVTSLGKYSFNSTTSNGITVPSGWNTLQKISLPNVTFADSYSFAGQNLKYISQTDPSASAYIPSLTAGSFKLFMNLKINNLILTASLPNFTELWDGTFNNINTAPLGSNGGLTKISQTEDGGGVYIPNVAVFRPASLSAFGQNRSLVSASLTNPSLGLYPLGYYRSNLASTMTGSSGWYQDGMFQSCTKLNRVSDTDPTWPIYIPAYPTGSVNYTAPNKTTPSATFLSCTSLNSCSLSNHLSLGSQMFNTTACEYVSNLDSTAGFYFPNVKQVGQNTFSACTSLKKVILHNLNRVDLQAFTGSVNLDYIDLTGLLNNNTALGGGVASQLVFQWVSTTGTLTIPTYFATNNGGNPDGDIQYLLTAPYSWTINYV